jgi:hypothetical protein
MPHHPKWKLIDKKNPVRKVVGRLRKAYIYVLDGDLNFQIQPDKEYLGLIEQDGLRNEDGRIECEVEVLDRYEDQVMEAFEHGIGDEFTAYGVWVNDTPHGSKFELHPLDALFTRLRGKHVPLWTAGFKNKYRGSRLWVHRVLAAADQSDKRYPPLTDKTRTTVVEIPYPKKPADTARKRWVPDYKSRIAINEHCYCEFKIGGTFDRPQLLISLTPRSFRDGEPGLMLFDIVTWWRPEQIESLG